MSLLHITGGAAEEDKLDASDVFSAYVRTGTGADVTVTTNIDMTKGYMVWTKGRSGNTDHAIYDSARGVTKDLVSNTTAAQTTQSTGLKAVSTTGHTIGSLAKMNTSGATYVDWVFKKAPKFFDIVTYTGDGVAGRQIPHALGIAPGMVIVKRIDSSGIWAVYHRGTGAAKVLQLEDIGAAYSNSAYWNNTEPSDADFTVGNNAYVNSSGAQYVAYLFAHDPSADGIIQCGSYVGNSSVVNINLGWEPQFLIVKNTTDNTGWGNWLMCDTMRGMPVSGNGAQLFANSATSEGQADRFFPSPTGFYVNNSGSITSNSVGQTYIYLAIRRPNKVPTSGSEVYNAIARTGTGTAATVTGVGFAPDLVHTKSRTRTSGASSYEVDRLRGNSNILNLGATSAETTTNGVMTLDQDGTTLDGSDWLNGWSWTFIHHFFRRAPGFFDVVCYTGTGVAMTVNHNLGVVPELMIVKNRDSTDSWYIYSSFTGNTKYLKFHVATTTTTIDAWYNTSPTDSSFTVGGGSGTNGTSQKLVAYLFATLAGVSKVGSYTGNGTSQTINCGFSTGARFVLSKAVSTTGNWNIGDSTRGITSGTDPLLCLNTTAAEVTTDDWLDPSAEGFIVNETASAHANTNGVTYIYLAIA